MSELQESLDVMVGESWDMVLRIDDDFGSGASTADFEKNYGAQLDILGIEANMLAGDAVPPDFSWNLKTAIDWYLGQLRDICLDCSADDYDAIILAGGYMERALAWELIGDRTHFYFQDKRFLGKNLRSLFAQIDEYREQQAEYFKNKYLPNAGWHNPASFPGSMIFSDFCCGDRRQYKGIDVAILLKPVKPDGFLEEARGTITVPYVSDEAGRVGAIFELELEDGERKKYNANRILNIRAREQGDKTHHALTAKLRDEGFVLFSGSGFIPAKSELAIIEASFDTHSFSVRKYIMADNRHFAIGCYSIFTALREEGEAKELNISDLGNVMYVREIASSIDEN